MSTHSIDQDHEKMTHPSPDDNRPSISTVIIRLSQYLISIPTLILGILAIDRSLLSDRWYTDVAIIEASSCVALLVLPPKILYSPIHRSTLTIIGDSLTSLLFLVSIIIIAVYQSQHMGSCSGPATIGVFDNLRACVTMRGAAVLGGIDCALFGITAIMQVWKN
ncbi:hypothetical protein I302_101108 [Kwoniella bestiolae CBS 10118]|uniref:MARVEL domain-containing protein n=1 Tax=Kwoniella bestiolae CBS 10118 TaxID=1296100 RepID=A0A1B9G715_9TREE|nr:hypothetical protein I302_04483 [Kwoniella bestiolae CBS 10118]OCF26793.1 hypothetical protein I302_04483 [Kwoniella bestiolae CBS 10118]